MASETALAKSVKATIASVIAYPVTRDWIVAESNGDVHITHYKETGDKVLYGSVSGVVVDTSHRYIACPTITFIEVALWEPALPHRPSDGALLLPDGAAYFDDVTLYRGYEGYVVRAWKDLRGVVRLSSLKHLEVRGSTCRRETGPLYEDLYRLYGGPSPESLFDPSHKYSPFVHSFMVMSKHSTMVSKHPAAMDELLIYLGTEKVVLPAQVIADTEKVPVIPVTTNDWATAVRDHVPYAPPPLSEVEATEFLRTGYGSAGESLLVYHRDGTKYRLESPAYAWRLNIRANINVQCAFSQLYTRVRNGEDVGAYRELPPSVLNGVRDGAPLVLSGEGAQVKRPPRIACYALMCAVPCALEGDVLRAMDRYSAMPKAIVAHLTAMSLAGRTIKDVRVSGILAKCESLRGDALAQRLHRYVSTLSPEEIHQLHRLLARKVKR